MSLPKCIIGEKLFKEKDIMLTNEQFTCLAEKYIDTVFRVAYNYLRSATDADDITQNVFLNSCTICSTIDTYFSADASCCYSYFFFCCYFPFPWHRNTPIKDSFLFHCLLWG